MDANVMCKDIGFSEAVEKLILEVDDKNKTIISQQYHCKGTEKYMIECRSSEPTNLNSSHTNVVGVRCKHEGKNF